MVKLTPKQRKVQRDHLTRRRNTLKKQGAINADIKRLIGGYNFAGLSDKQLSNLYNRSKNSKPVTVVDGKIVDKSYLAKVKAWYGINYEPSKLSSSYQKSLKSTLNKFNSIKEIKQHKSDVDKRAKQRYIDQLEYLLEKHKNEGGLSQKSIKSYQKTINRIRRMSRQGFKDFVNGDVSGKVDFDTIFLIDSPTNQSDASYNDFDFSTISNLFDDLDRFSNQFIQSRKRR